ncbi:(5-formylfuran-3-yl)methyl phosphate synthase [Dethiosulfatarculus sandiegensis]|uniref:(5-formylfuran-3-yl)methyl phosphate synthase n=1 Tax=Dethiosulfatarculus sandiegensis TaxID=1429043 RepID=A0A0D2J1P8_9BACT|nr:(5-formylfuran-3-yl)methyl phosphate synthase [Dethiosulfatarculus sandiegensis]KIX12139.1 hypothetical protein X474_20330 [Dethiosulfatarculus sandiegensis]
MRLLVSVANSSEVRAALLGKADIIDVKNPAEGALGANFPRVIKEIRKLTPKEIPVSATIGDMPNLPGTASLAALGAAHCGVEYVKVGLKGVTEVEQATTLMREVCLAVSELPEPPEVIATAYADASLIPALLPEHLPEVAAKAGAHGCLIDTLGKSSQGLVDLMSPEELKNFVVLCKKAGLLCGLAGSLSKDTLPLACKAGPDLVGVRTAAINGDRVNGLVQKEKVEELKSIMLSAGSL